MGSGLYKDESFDFSLPADRTSVSWVRPGALCTRPMFYTNMPCPCDVKQGWLGNCYFIAALHQVIIYHTVDRPDLLPDLLNVIGPWQNFERPEYRGKFSFWFWNGFARTRVDIDDRLPVSRDGELVFAKNFSGSTGSREAVEFWPMLLEKAFVKFTNSSYRDMDEGGLPAQVLRFLFRGGGKSETLRFLSTDSVARTIEPGRLVSAAIMERKPHRERGSASGRSEEIFSNNLACRHAYSVSKRPDGTLQVINPWFSNEYADASRERGGNTATTTCDYCEADADLEHDGRWIMTVEEFTREFDTLFVFTPHLYAYYGGGSRTLSLGGGGEEASFVPQNKKTSSLISANALRLFCIVSYAQADEQ